MAFIAADALSLLEMRRLLTGEETTFVFATVATATLPFDSLLGDTVILVWKRPQSPSMSLEVGLTFLGVILA